MCSGSGPVCPRGMVQSNIHEVLDEEVCWIQMQQSIVTVSQGDMVILKREKCGGIYKLKEENSVRGGVSGISLEGSLLRGEALMKTATGREPGQSVAGKRKGAFGRGL